MLVLKQMEPDSASPLQLGFNDFNGVGRCSLVRQLQLSGNWLQVREVTDHVVVYMQKFCCGRHPFSCGLAGKAVLSKDFQDARRKFSVKFNKTGNINFLIVLAG